MKNKLLTLTIVIPVYNEQRYIGDCLKRIALQTQMPKEVIVVDNHSTDNTAKIVQKYSFARVVKEPRRGIVFARNKGFDSAGSEIIGRIDADTWLAADWVEKTLQAFTDNPRVAAVTGDCYFYDFPMKKPFHLIHKFVYYILQKPIAGTDILWGSNMAVRSSAWQKVKKFTSTDTNIHEDIDLTFRLKDKDLRIKHVKAMQAEVSLRRGDLGVISLNRYLSAWHHTYMVNRRFVGGLMVFVLGALTLIGALALKPFHRFIKQVS